MSIKVSYKVILSLLLDMIKHSQYTQSSKFPISLQYPQKEVRNGVYFLQADKHQGVYKLGFFFFLMEVARYFQNAKSRKLVIHFQYILRVLQQLLCSIVIKIFRYFMGVQSCLLLLVSLHSQAVGVFCLSTAMQKLNRNYVGRSCHLFCICSKLMFFKRSRVYCRKSNYAHQTSQKKLVPGLVIQIPPKVFTNVPP